MGIVELVREQTFTVVAERILCCQWSWKSSLQLLSLSLSSFDLTTSVAFFADSARRLPLRVKPLKLSRIAVSGRKYIILLHPWSFL